MSNESPEIVPRLGDPVEEEPLKFWLRFSLRSALVMMLLAGLFLAWMGIRQQRSRRQEAVVAKLAPYGVSNKKRDGNVVQLSFSGDAFKNEAIAFLHELPDLERIVLIDTNADDETLKLLRPFGRLTDLLVMNAPVTDDGLKHVKALPRLDVLWLASTKITDDGLQHLSALKTLRRLNLKETDIGDEGLEHLRTLTNLEKLTLRSTKVTGEGVDSLKQSLPNANIDFE